MTGSRRSFLHALSIGSAGLTAGCLGSESVVQQFGSDDEADASSVPAEPQTKPGEADTLVAEHAVTDENLTYLPDEHAVQYIAMWRHTNREEVEEGEKPERKPVYETKPFDEWAETECRFVASRAAKETVIDRLDSDENGLGAGVSSAVPGYEDELVATINLQWTLDRDGTVVAEPTVTLDRVVAATPKTVEATVSLAEREHTCTVPIVVREAVMRYN
ncbi:hypothetical protein SAMN04487948_104351 [Halogranum amylolyticum]|uniref:Uncharacterized protein n=1 Tax=Halogranum amylolyticum TaxID=660520 RepID=A0A1H8RZV8_9EURY|nr:hypothetical protein [Halogranum amylolyticum]SEO71950.1 hypothetical protein SAMN04487948_104351 [Halogranum amylolyticum]